jgi:hypothetical protein
MFTFHRNSRILRGLALLAFACALVFGAQPAAPVPFRASYSLNFVADFSAFPLVGVASVGSALTTHLGKASTRSISETVNLATGEGVAVHEFTAANGDSILFSFHLVAIPTSETQFTIDGVWVITGGTGRFDGATGEGSYHGLAQFNSPTTGSAEFELAGVISSVGSNK